MWLFSFEYVVKIHLRYSLNLGKPVPQESAFGVIL